jgi:hypothetical protein
MLSSCSPCKNFILSAVAQACNTSYSGDRDWKDHGLISAKAKNSQDPHFNHDWAQWRTPVIPATNRRMSAQVSLDTKQDSTSKITNAKRHRGMA